MSSLYDFVLMMSNDKGNIQMLRMSMCWGLLLLVSFATYSHELNGNSLVKQLAFGVALSIMLLVSVLGWSSKVKRLRPWITAFDVAVTLLAAMYLFRCIGEADIFKVAPAVMCVVFYCFVRCSDMHFHIGVLMCAAPFVLVAHLVLCLLQWGGLLPNYHSFFRIGGTFGNPDMLSAYMSVLLPTCYLPGKHRRLRFAVLLLVFAGFLLLQSRTAIVASAVPLAMYCIRTWHIGKSMTICGCIVAVVAFVFLVMWHPVSFLGRVYVWIVFLWMMVTRPLGWGIHAFDKHYMEQQAMFTVANPGVASALNYDNVDSPYNEFLNIGVMLGVAAMLIYVWLVAMLLLTLHRNRSGLFYPLLTFQVLSLSYFPFSIAPLMALYVALCGCAVNLYSPCIFRMKCRLGVARFIGVAASVSVALVVAGSWIALEKWKEARAFSDCATVSGRCYESVWPLLKDNGRFLVSFANMEFGSGDSVAALSLLQRAERCHTGEAFLLYVAEMQESNGCMAEAKRNLLLAANMTRLNAEATYFQISFLLRNGLRAEAVRAAASFMERVRSSHKDFSVRDKFYISRIENVAK